MPIASAARDQIKLLPCKHLGHVEYVERPSAANYRAFFLNLTPQEQHYVDHTLHGSAPAPAPAPHLAPVPVALPLLPDFVCNHLNCTIDVRIPRYQLYHNDNVYQRHVWGTDVYTDDSDVVAILYHCGILQSTDPLADVSPHPQVAPLSAEPRYPVQPDSPAADVSDVLVVRLRILPPLTAYHGCYRHCYNSRTWAGPAQHDGASVAIDSVRWCRRCNRGPGLRELR